MPEVNAAILHFIDGTREDDITPEAREVKLPIYARLGIQEVWIEDLKSNTILVYRDPTGTRYKSSLTFRRKDSLSPLAFPDSTFKVEDLLG